MNISAAEIEQCFRPKEIIEIVRRGVVEEHNGVYMVPDRLHLDSPSLTFLVMPAMGPDYFCTKLISVVPNNPKIGKELITGFLILSDAKAGVTLATMDAPMITNLRTAAIGAIGLDLISAPSIDSIGIIGCGNQGIWQAIFAGAVRNIKRIYCFNRTIAKYAYFQKKVLENCKYLKLVFCDSADEVVEKSEVIYTCTGSEAPVFSDDDLLVKNKKFISIGSFKPNMQELPKAVYAQTKKLIVDSALAREEVGDVINALQHEWIGENDLLTLGAVMTAKKSPERKKLSVFKSVGMAAFDLALAAAVYEKRREA